MFGYVRPRWDTLPEPAAADYEAVYCGLCHRMGERYGQLTRCFLHYDFAFLAILLMPEGEHLCPSCRSCPRHPIQGKPTCAGTPWLDAAAGKSVILTYWKLRDTVADGSFFQRFAARGLCVLLKGAYKKARRDEPDFDRAVQQCLSELRVLEREGCPSIDRTADCFARLLQAAAGKSGDTALDRERGALLYQLGRWIYLLDGVDDLEEDRQAGRYNPVAARFPEWSQEDKAYLRELLDHSLSLTAAAFELLPRNSCTPAVENIIYSGLPAVEELVFSGRWREDQREHRRSSL